MKYLIVTIASLFVAYILNFSFNALQVRGIDLQVGWSQRVGEKQTSEPVRQEGFPLQNQKMWSSYGFEIPPQADNSFASLLNFVFWFILSFSFLNLITRRPVKK